jgi:hypothetical protein
MQACVEAAIWYYGCKNIQGFSFFGAELEDKNGVGAERDYVK